ncbi:MAG: hypothetical protein M5R36_00070 [Deltaproteobacteria bacterium]|nr:hypothetical protein [Deltaproteobacteria bacterium]
MSGILEWCRAHGAEMVIVQPIYIEDPKTPLLADFARENNVRYVNLPALLAEDRARGGMFLDGVHPSDIGHRLIGRALARELFGVDKPDAG